MFKGLAGLKKAVKGGFSVVAEHSSQLAEQVVGDPSNSKDHLKESIKKKVASVVEATDSVIASDNTVQAKDKAAEVVHKVKHYGAFGEEYLGYSDPTKDLRKAVKQKEKAAKKAKKANKKKTGKKEDLFDPANLEKYKREIEQRRLEKEAALAKAQEADSEGEEGAAGSGADRAAGHDSDVKSPESGRIRFNLDLAPDSPNATTPLRSPKSPVRTPKEETEDWKLFQSLASGVDSIILQKKAELEEIKQESYFQRKPIKTTDDESEEEEKGAKKKKKKWINLDSAGFDDFDGTISGEEADENEADDKTVNKKNEEKEEQKEENDEDKKPAGFVEIPEDEPIDVDEDDNLFNTTFVDALTRGDVKLAVIPDDPIYDPNDDPFNTGFADAIVKKDKEEKRREASRIKFTGLSSVADVLSGKADKVDQGLVELTVKQKRRRANRINLIGEKENELTTRDQIGSFGPEQPAKPDQELDIFAAFDANNDVSVAAEPLSLAGAVPLPPVPVVDRSAAGRQAEADRKNLDLAEFEEFLGEKRESSLTSNVAILAGEFAKPLEEQEDDFDAAFDALAQESVTKYKLDELEREFADEDVFDTTGVDNILNLVSLANKVEEPDTEIYDTFEDKDPFDTSAYEEVLEVLEEEIGFESLAKRDPKEEASVGVVEGAGADVFGGGAAPEPVVDSGWAAFKEEKPARPPPPKPRPEPPRRPPQVYVNPSSRPNTPSVVVKAPSTESIKSWNISVAENLIRKSEIEALEASVLAEEEFDPFDTTQFAEVGEPDEAGAKEDVTVDPFDTSEVPDFEKEEQLKREAEEAARKAAEVDLLTADNEEEVPTDLGEVTIVPDKGPEPDPFDTGFAAKVLPNHGDPFDTSFVTGCPGKAEIQALEEEFIDKDEFDPRTAEGTSIPRKTVAPGAAGRARPVRGQATDLKVKVPIPVAPVAAVAEATSATEADDEEEDDPFDTSIVNKVIPVRKAAQPSDVSVEDDDFDPTSTFAATRKEEIDPFDTTIVEAVIPETKVATEVEKVVPEVTPEPVVTQPPPPPQPEPAIQPKELEIDGKKFKILPPARPRRSAAKKQVQEDDDDFDPRA